MLSLMQLWIHIQREDENEISLNVLPILLYQKITITFSTVFKQEM